MEFVKEYAATIKFTIEEILILREIANSQTSISDNIVSGTSIDEDDVISFLGELWDNLKDIKL